MEFLKLDLFNSKAYFTLLPSGRTFLGPSKEDFETMFCFLHVFAKVNMN